MCELIKNTLLMKKVLFFTIMLFSQLVNSQEFKQDERTQDSINKLRLSYIANNIGSGDILQALEMLGIQIHKFKLGKFDQEYELIILLQKYHQGKLEKTDTIMNTWNTYPHFDENGTEYFDYIKEINIITNALEEKSDVKVITGRQTQNSYKIDLPKSNGITFFEWREYKNTKWKLNKKIPLLIYASSWRDENYDIERFCGVKYLEENSEGENEIFKYSPNYAIISYKIIE